MTSLNRNFNGDRLKAARLYNGMSITELSKEVQISSQAVSQYENGKIAPKTDVLLRIMGTLGFPRGYFYEDGGDELVIGDTYFRSPSSTLKREKLAKQLSFKGHRQCEPLDAETPLPQPRYLKHALKMIFDKRLLSHEGFFNELSNRGFTLNTTMVEQLLDLNPGYFRINRGHVRSHPVYKMILCESNV